MLFVVGLIFLLNHSARSLDLKTFNTYLIKNDDSSVKCLLQKEVFLMSLENRTKWAMSSKFSETLVSLSI